MSDMYFCTHTNDHTCMRSNAAVQSPVRAMPRTWVLTPTLHYGRQWTWIRVGVFTKVLRVSESRACRGSFCYRLTRPLSALISNAVVADSV